MGGPPTDERIRPKFPTGRTAATRLAATGKVREASFLGGVLGRHPGTLGRADEPAGPEASVLGHRAVSDLTVHQVTPPQPDPPVLTGGVARPHIPVRGAFLKPQLVTVGLWAAVIGRRPAWQPLEASRTLLSLRDELWTLSSGQDCSRERNFLEGGTSFCSYKRNDAEIPPCRELVPKAQLWGANESKEPSLSPAWVLRPLPPSAAGPLLQFLN